MNDRPSRAAIAALSILLASSLLTTACGSDDPAVDEADAQKAATQKAAAVDQHLDVYTHRDADLLRTSCAIDDQKECRANEACAWIEPMGCLSDEPLPGEPFPPGISFHGEYSGEIRLGEAVIGHEKDQSARLFLAQDDDWLQGELAIRVAHDKWEAQLEFTVQGRVRPDEIDLAFIAGKCTAVEGLAPCETWYNDGLTHPERFVARGYIEDERLHFLPATPRNPAGKIPLFDSMRMRPHDGFKPSTLDAGTTADAHAADAGTSLGFRDVR
jgi:hypothetical protein